MLSYENFICRINMIAEDLYNRLGFADTFIVFFRHGYEPDRLNDDYVIVSWGSDDLVFDNDFNEGQDFYMIDNVISISTLRRSGSSVCDEPVRRKGHINISNHIEYCSECGKSLGIGYTNYCGYCGAELEP